MVNKFNTPPKNDELVNKVNEIIDNLSVTDQTFDGTSTNAQSGVAISDELEKYQDKLISATNIKTINEVSILGNGNLDLFYSPSEWTTPVRSLPITTSEEGDWYGIAYNNEKYIALSGNGYISTAIDLVTWTNPTKKITATNFGNLAYGNGTFLTINESGDVFSSSDGENWGTLGYGLSSGVYCLIYANDKFIALSQWGTCETSIDGETWNESYISSSDADSWYSISYGNGMYIALSGNGYISTSTDLVTWTNPELKENLYYLDDNDRVESYDWRHIKFINNKFTAISRYGRVSESADGINWCVSYIDNSLSTQTWDVGGLINNYDKYILINANGYISTIDKSIACANNTLSNVISISSNSIVASKNYVNNITDNKQDVLISSVNIKTINNESLLGSGNINISSGGTITIDQVYDPASPNAQSGVAISGAGFITSADLPTNHVTTDTAQDISGRKTFLGEKAIYFKQQAATNKLGFTLYNVSNAELGALEYRPNTINGGALLNVNVPYSSNDYVGFRYWGTAVNIIAPKVSTAGNYYIPVNVTDGTNTVTANSTGTLNISSLLSDFVTDSDLATTLSDYATQTWVGQQGYLTAITSSDVTNALGYTPYNSTNPNGYTSNVGTVTSVNNAQPDNNGNVSINIPTIDDTTPSTTTVYSSQKTQDLIDALVTRIAALESNINGGNA